MSNNFDELIQGIHGGNMFGDDEPEVININILTRAIIIPEGFNTQIAATNDVNSNQITFKCSKTIDGHSVFNCSKKIIKWHNLASDERGSDDMLNIKEVENNKFTFTWLVPKEALTMAGILQIAISFIDESEERIVYKWSTLPSSALSVVQGLDTVKETYREITPSKIITIDGSTRIVTIPEDLNKTIAYVGDVGTAKLNFRIDRYVGGNDLSTAGLAMVRWTAADGTQGKEGLTFTAEEDWIEFTWKPTSFLTNIEGVFSFIITIIKERNTNTGDSGFAWNSQRCEILSIGSGEPIEDIAFEEEDGLALVNKEALEALLLKEYGYEFN